MRREIPGPVMAVLSDVMSKSETHAGLDSLFFYAGAFGDPPLGNKQVKVLEWLRRTNREPKVDPMSVLGKIIENYIEGKPLEFDYNGEFFRSRKERVERILAEAGLQYLAGGKMGGSLGSPSHSLHKLIRDRDLASINQEFDRALTTVESNPKEAVSAACNILEAVCKTYIEDENLKMPAKQDLQPVWNVVRKHLGFDPAMVADRDLQEILTGLFAVVGGIGALRTHASSAHAPGRKVYRLEPRHARLAVHSAHTCALFILESWHKRSGAA